MVGTINIVIKKLHTKHFVDWQIYSLHFLDDLHLSEQCIVYLGLFTFSRAQRRMAIPKLCFVLKILLTRWIESDSVFSGSSHVVHTPKKKCSHFWKLSLN